MDTESVPCIRCDYALGLMKEKRYEDVGAGLVGIGNAVAADKMLGEYKKKALNEILVYMIQNISYGSNPPKTVVITLARSMAENSAGSQLVHKLCVDLQRLIDGTYP